MGDLNWDILALRRPLFLRDIPWKNPDYPEKIRMIGHLINLSCLFQLVCDVFCMYSFMVRAEYIVSELQFAFTSW